MAKIVTRKRRRLNFTGIAAVIFTVSLFVGITMNLLINTVNTSLTMKIQAMNEELVALRSANQTLSYEINNLENKDRIYAVAEAADLDQVSDNIISVAGE